MADDHSADFFVITVKAVGKKLSGSQLRLFSGLWIQQKFLIDNRIVFVHMPFCNFCPGKFFHSIPVAFINLGLLLFAGDHTCIDKGLPAVAKGIVIVVKIHQKRLGQLSLIGDIHSLHIIFIQPCKPQPLLDCQRKPAEIFRLVGISLHHIFAHCFQNILGRKFFIACHKSLIQTSGKILLISGQISHTHNQLFCKQASFSRKAEHLDPERTEPVKKCDILADPLPGFHIKKRTCAASFKLFFHHKDSL